VRPPTDTQTDTDARDHNTVRVVYDSREVYSYSPGGADVLTWEGTLAPPGVYD